ncbi:MAG: PorT family protein [Bacteroidales bacterium]|nr:PorT family protein [Bacteroidales bacterium]
MNKRLFLLLLLVAAFVPMWAQEVEAPMQLDEPTVERNRHWSVGVTGGIDRNYHIINMSYMNEYSYSPFAEGSSYGVQLSFSPLKWLTLRVDGVMLDKNYYRDHVVGGTTMSLPDTTYNKYLNVPVVLMLNVGKTVRLHAFGGGYWGYWLESRRKGITQSMNGLVSYDETVDFDTPESQVRDNRTDVGLVWGGGLSGVVKNRIEIGVEARWYYGLYDIQQDYMAHLNPRYNTTLVFQGGISYWF